MGLSFILGNRNPKKASYISGVNFQARKTKKACPEKMPYILGNGTF